jgi:hypothetical protein
LAAGVGLSPLGCGEAPERGDEQEAVSEAQSALTDVACSTFQDHGGNLFENSFPATLGCAVRPGFRRGSFTVTHGGAGNCHAVGAGWSSPSDVHDGHVNVTITNSAGFLTGTCTVVVTEDSEPPAHPLCSSGAKLAAVSTPCATQICAADSFCCNTGWDNVCVGEVRSICHSDICVAAPCTHPECAVGSKLTNGCSTTVTAVCGRDPFCCDNQWDNVCVAEVASLAGQNCGP